MTKKIVIVLAVALFAVPSAFAAKPTNAGTSNSKGVKTLTAKLAGASGMKGNLVVRLNASKNQVCWAFSNLKLNGNVAFAAHIHVRAGGGIKISLGDIFARRGCTTNNVDAAWSEAIDLVIATPTAYYVNVHKQAGLEVLITGNLKKGAPAPA